MDFTSPPMHIPNLRVSKSPALSPRLVDASEGRARSVHLETMEDSMLDQLDQGLQTSDFFDENSSDSDSHQMTDRKEPLPLQVTDNQQEKHSGYDPSKIIQKCGQKYGDQTIKYPPPRPPPPSQYVSYDPEVFVDPKILFATQRPFSNGLDGIPLENEGPGPGSSGNTWSRYDVADRLPTAPEVQGQGAAVKSFSVNQQILNAHALTVQALCQNDVLGNQQVHSNRTSEEIMGLGVEDSLKSKKKIHILPPPINVKSRGLGFKEHIPTPHPITIRKSYAHQSQANKHSVQNESFLALGLRWHTDRNPRRMMKLAIPADLDIASTRKVSSPRAKQHQTEMHFETLEFDDAHFFRELRKAYACLAGPFRFFSPRSLHKIEISHSGSCTNCRSSGSANPFLSPSLTCGIPSPRSPRFLISQGLTDSFSEANLLEQYHKPKIGKAQYIWVHWAHRISTTSLHLRSPVPMPPAGSPAERAATTGTHMGLSHNVIDDEASEADCVAGLDFVEKWAPWRILSAITLTVLLAIAAALIWIFLGMSSEALHTSFRGAGERVASGCLVGMFALLIGFAVVASWVSVSWLVN